MTRAGSQDFAFRFESPYQALARLFGVKRNSAYVRAVDDCIEARFGPWLVRTPLSNISSVSVTGPYRVVKTAGPARFSIADRGLTFASNAAQGVCLQFIEPVRGLDPFGLIRHPNLTVTVEDITGLTQLLNTR